MLARRYGGRVVIHRELPDMNIKDRKLSEPEECWDFIAEDLDFAAEHLPVTAEKGKLVKGGHMVLRLGQCCMLSVGKRHLMQQKQ